MRPVTAAPGIRAADVGPTTILLDVRRGVVYGLPGQAGLFWASLASTGELDAAIDSTPSVRPAELRHLTVRLLDKRILRRTSKPAPWAAPARCPAVTNEASLGTEETPMVSESVVAPDAPTRALALIVLFVTAATLRLLRFSWLLGLVRIMSSLSRHEAEAEQLDRAVLAVRWAGLRLPVRAECLANSLAAFSLLALRGRSAVWCLGVACDPVRSHAWIETWDGQRTETAETAAHVPLLQIPPVRPTR